jgi:hypothetical protein
VTRVLLIGAILVSAINSVTFLAALVVAYMAADQANLGLLIGAVIANMSAVISYWLGSSSSSLRKTDIIAGSLLRKPEEP